MFYSIILPWWPRSLLSCLLILTLSQFHTRNCAFHLRNSRKRFALFIYWNLIVYFHAQRFRSIMRIIGIPWKLPMCSRCTTFNDADGRILLSSSIFGCRWWLASNVLCPATMMPYAYIDCEALENFHHLKRRPMPMIFASLLLAIKNFHCLFSVSRAHFRFNREILPSSIPEHALQCVGSNKMFCYDTNSFIIHCFARLHCELLLLKSPSLQFFSIGLTYKRSPE